MTEKREGKRGLFAYYLGMGRYGRLVQATPGVRLVGLSVGTKYSGTISANPLAAGWRTRIVKRRDIEKITEWNPNDWLVQGRLGRTATLPRRAPAPAIK